jgi:hypothetical protein
MAAVPVLVEVGGIGVAVLVAVEITGELVAVKTSSGPVMYVVFLLEQEETVNKISIASVPVNMKYFFKFFSL